MNWEQVCESPHLKDLPYKIELNERGQILMSPARLIHSGLQAQIIKFLVQFNPEGFAIPDFALSTPQGTKVPDVVWCSDRLWNTIKHGIESAVAPEVCIEVLSPSNTPEEMEEKKALYFAQGALEVWICEESGQMAFFDADTPLVHSHLFPDFPQQIQI